MNEYLERACELTMRSHEEMKKALITNDIVMIREVAGKAWLAVVEGLNGFLLSSGIPQNKLPKSDFERKKALEKIVKDTDIIRTYRYLRLGLHIGVYYEREYDKNTMDDYFNYLDKWLDFCTNGNGSA